MSRLGKVSLFLSGLSVVIMVSVRYLLDGWHNILFIPLAVFLIGLVAAIVVDIKFYVEFLSMRTTKHGMNMGVMILLAILLLVSVNFLGVKFNKTFDFTEEHTNSLSLQTRDVLKGLKEDLKVVIFYKGEEAREERNKVKTSLELYKEATSKLQVSTYNSYVENFKAQEYLSELPDKDRGNVFVFVEYGGKKTRVESPYSEEQITQAIIKSTRTLNKNIYFLEGHGERDLASPDPEGLESFKKALEADSFKVEKLNLIEKGSIPENADVIAIIGPASQLFPQELQLLEAYAAKGGRLLIAADPGQKHNLSELAKYIGVDWKGNYVINNGAYRIIGKGQVSAVGVKFDTSSDITKRLASSGSFASFDFASEVVPGDVAKIGLKATELVHTDPASFTLTELKNPKTRPEQRTISLGVQVKGHFKAPSKEGDTAKKEDSKQEFEGVVYGDSDFLTNRGINEGLNRDLALNSVAFLEDQGDLVSIRSPQPKGTKLTMNRTVQFGFVIGCLLLPLMMLMTSGTLWFRRRSA